MGRERHRGQEPLAAVPGFAEHRSRPRDKTPWDRASPKPGLGHHKPHRCDGDRGERWAGGERMEQGDRDQGQKNSPECRCSAGNHWPQTPSSPPQTLLIQSQRGWLGTLSETCQVVEGMGGTPGRRGGAEKRAEPHRGAASHPKK